MREEQQLQKLRARQEKQILSLSGNKKDDASLLPNIEVCIIELTAVLVLMSFHIAECNIRECWRENSGFRIWSASSLPTSSPFLSTVAEDETLAVLRHVTRDT